MKMMKDFIIYCDDPDVVEKTTVANIEILDEQIDEICEDLGGEQAPL